MYKLFVKINGFMTCVKFSFYLDEIERAADYYHDQGYYTEVIYPEWRKKMALPKKSGIICPICNNEFTAAEAKVLWAALLSTSTKGRTSQKKAAASAENGKKGGRPRKVAK